MNERHLLRGAQSYINIEAGLALHPKAITNRAKIKLRRFVYYLNDL